MNLLVAKCLTDGNSYMPMQTLLHVLLSFQTFLGQESVLSLCMDGSTHCLLLCSHGPNVRWCMFVCLCSGPGRAVLAALRWRVWMHPRSLHCPWRPREWLSQMKTGCVHNLLVTWNRFTKGSKVFKLKLWWTPLIVAFMDISHYYTHTAS